MTTVNDFDFTGAMGGEAAEAAAKSGASFRRFGYFNLDASPSGIAAGNHKAIFRLLSENAARPQGDPRAHEPGSAYGVPWITVDMHSMVPTKAQPADWPAGRSWPRSMGAVCRNDKVFKARFGDCFICANLKKVVNGVEKKFPASGRTWALAVLREEVVGDGSPALGGEAMKGRVVGYRDKTKEIVKTVDGKETGETEVVPDIVVVQQAWKNFWSALAGMAQMYGTAMDRDYHITRSGTDQSTTYQIVPLDPIRLAEGNKYGLPGGSVYDLSNPALIKALYPDLPDLRSLVVEQANDEYYARFFDTTKASPPIKQAGTNGQAAPAQPAVQGPTAQPAAPQTEPSGDALAALRNRVSGYSGDPAAAAAPAPAAAAAAEAAPAAAAAEPAPAQEQTPVVAGGLAL